jgi:hypothetical protein
MKHRFQIVGKKPQTDLILDHLAAKQSISGVEAWNLYSVRCLPRRIADLKEVGHRFSTQSAVAPNGQRYVRYHYLGFSGLPGSAVSAPVASVATGVAA